MRNKIITGMMLLLAFVVSSCSDDDYTINTAEIITTVETGTAQVGATNAVLTGTVLDLSKSASSSYSVGVYYSTSEDPTSGTKATGSLAEDGTVTTSLTGLTTDVTYYYCTYVTLQGKVTKYGEVKSFVTTAADIATAEAVYNIVDATLGGTLTVETTSSDEVVRGVLVSLDEANVKSGRLYQADDTEGNAFSIPVSGLIPGKTYYYVAYAKVNAEEKYGEVKSFTTASQEVEFVDLGLSVEWATVNVGALNPEEAGGLYGYGDNTLFNVSTQASDYVAEDIQATANDLASLYIPGAFTPTKTQMEELVNNTTAEYTEVNGVKGYRFTGSNGNSIFLPMTGTRTGTTTSEATLGAYWTASVDAVDGNYAAALSLTDAAAKVTAAQRYEGLAIRAVRTPNRPMELSYLYKTWSIDLDANGKSYVWDGPLYYYGTEDSWNTVTNGYSLGEGHDSWNWCPSYADNSWIATAMDHGTMTFNEDGTVTVNDKGNNVQYTGTFTVDTKEHTITLTGAKILHLENFDAIVSNWSTELKVMSLSDDGLQIAALRDQSDEGPCLLVHNYVNTALVSGKGKGLEVDNSKLLYGDIEGNGNLRLELYNEYGSGSKDNPCFDLDALSFSKTLAVTFKLSGVTLKEGAAGQYDAALSYASPDWSISYWGGTPKYDAIVTGDGTYTVWMEPDAAASGAVVFVVDVKGLAADIADMSSVKAEVVSITTDAEVSNYSKNIAVDNSKILFNNKDGNGTDGRIEIYNEYGSTKDDPGVSQSDISFNGRMVITFTIAGIDGNLNADATNDYKAELSYAAASWSPSYWGGGAVGSAQVTKDGTYTVYADMGDDDAEGAVVWCIELYGLWKDLVDTSKVSVTIDEISVEPKK